MGKHSKSRTVLDDADLAATFDGPSAERFPPVLSVRQVAELLGVPKSTIYHKSSEGKFDGMVTKVAGKLRFFRDKLLKQVFAHGL